MAVTKSNDSTVLNGSVGVNSGDAINRAVSVPQALENSRRQTPFSVEFFPPKTSAGETKLWSAIQQFEKLSPEFVSMTYGAGGGTRDRTLGMTQRLLNETSLLPVAHLTAVGHSVAELRDLITTFANQGVVNLLALRGDPPGDPLGNWTKHPDGFEHASELVNLVTEMGGFTVGVAAFPEGHHRSPDLTSDTHYLVEKLRTGAAYSITQIFLEVDDYLRLRDRVVALDAEQAQKPIIPAIMPITSLASLRRMVELSGSVIPAAVEARLTAAAGHGVIEDSETVRKVGIDLATELSAKLIAEGVAGLHFCCLNDAGPTGEVIARLDIS